MKFLLLSYPINENTPAYGETPKPCIMPLSQISRGDANNLALITIHNHTGTHIDAPKHFVDDGREISDYSLDELIFKNPVVIDCLRNKESLLTPDDLQHASQKLQKSDCLLIHTGFGKYRSEERYRTHNPGIAPETMLWVREKYPNIRCIGIDSISISPYQFRNAGREAHKAAFIVKEGLGEPLLLIEDMNLENVSECKLKLIIVLPWQVENVDSAPCSIFAEVE